MGAHGLVSMADRCSPNPAQICVDAKPLIDRQFCAIAGITPEKRPSVRDDLWQYRRAPNCANRLNLDAHIPRCDMSTRHTGDAER